MGVEDFFNNTGGGGAPSLKIVHVNDGCMGTIVDQYTTEAKVFGKDEVKKDSKTGEPIEQLVVILQTTLTNWDRCAKIPWVDPNDRAKGQKPGSEDDGKRALYVEPWTNLHAAIGKAVTAATGQKGPLRDSGRLGVKIIELRDTDKGNPLKVWEAVYEAPTASSGFFAEGNTQGGSGDASQAPPQQQYQAPQSQPAPQGQAYAQGSSFGGGDHGMNPPAPQQQAPAPQPQQSAPPSDPWGTPQVQGNDGPPF